MLAALTCELGYEATDAERRRRLKSILTDARYSTFIAEMGGVVCGMIGTLTHASHEHNDLSEKIIALVVSKKQRRSGIGRALIAAAEKDFAERRVARVTLTTRFTRKEAHCFYEALGYERNGWRFVKQLSASNSYAIWRAWSVLSITAIALAVIQKARPAEPSAQPAEVEEVIVSAGPTGSLTSASSEESAELKAQVPGGFTVKSADKMKLGRASNFEDLLQRAPGVFLQSDNGAEVSKISIRGSGIIAEDGVDGVMVLLDGLSNNQGDGEANLEDLDVPRSVTRRFFAVPQRSNTVR